MARKIATHLSDSELSGAGIVRCMSTEIFSHVSDTGQTEIQSQSESWTPWRQVLFARCSREADMTAANHPYHRDAVFEPDETQAIGIAFDEICRAMNLPQTATVPREVVAMRVIDLARESLLDPVLLRNRVLHEVARQPSPDSETTPPSMWP